MATTKCFNKNPEQVCLYPSLAAQSEMSVRCEMVEWKWADWPVVSATVVRTVREAIQDDVKQSRQGEPELYYHKYQEAPQLLTQILEGNLTRKPHNSQGSHRPVREFHRLSRDRSLPQHDQHPDQPTLWRGGKPRRYIVVYCLSPHSWMEHSHWSRSVEILCSDRWNLTMLVPRSVP